MPSGPEISRQLEASGFAEIPNPLSKAHFEEAFGLFAGFVALTQEPGGNKLVTALSFNVGERGDSGYYFDRRRPGEINPIEPDRVPGDDHKDAYHHGPLSTIRARFALGGTLPREMADFLEIADDTLWTAVKVQRVGARALGLEETIHGAEPEDQIHLLRFLNYIAVKKEFLGEPHVDRSVTTVRMFEDKPGLMVAPFNNGHLEPIQTTDVDQAIEDMKPVDYVDGVAGFFLGAGYNHISDEIRAMNPDYPLLAHGVENRNPGEQRLAAVMFTNPHRHYPGYTVPTSHETGLREIRERLETQETAA